jgi:Uri superfamily endonuclease
MRGRDTLPRHTESCRESFPKGVYVLLLQGGSCMLCIGSLGERMFSAGWYAYVGSALGPGGFARVRRHHALYLYRDRPPRWHIDYLLLDPHFHLRYAICGPTGEDHECRLAHLLGPPEVPGFGCSDCRCSSHLFYRSTDPREETVSALERLGIPSVIKTIKSPG